MNTASAKQMELDFRSRKEIALEELASLRASGLTEEIADAGTSSERLRELFRLFSNFDLNDSRGSPSRLWRSILTRTRSYLRGYLITP